MSLAKFSHITILLADDHPLYRRGLKNVIKSLGFNGVILEAKNGSEVEDLQGSYLIDLYILDYKMPILTGYEAAKIILRYNPKAKIILNTMYNETQLINGFYKAGILGYIDKNSEPEQFEEAITCVLNGWGFYNSLEGKESFEELNDCATIQFTKREKDVIELLAQGYRTNDIAEKLALSFKTIEKYRCRLLEKVSVKNTSELLNFVHRNGLI